MSETLAGVIRCKVVRPLDGDWDRLGRILRALQAPAHRVLNAVVTDLELAKRAGEAVNPRTLAYRQTNQRWAEERDAARARCERQRGGYPGDDAIAEVAPGSNVVLGMAGAAFERWRRYDKERWRGTSTLPTFRAKPALRVAGAGASLAAKDGRHVLTIALLAGRGQRIPLAIQPYDGKDFAGIRDILDGTAKMGDVRIKRDSKAGRNKGKWMVLISRTWERGEAPADRTMAVHRGLRNFLTVAVAREGDRPARTRIVQTGDDIAKTSAVYRRRLRSLQQQGRQLGKGAKGRGRKRRHERITRLQAKHARRIATKCEQIAADLMRIAERDGVSRILVEDWANPAADGAEELGAHLTRVVRQFPMGQLRECIERAAAKRGLRVEHVATFYNSRRCPKCGHIHEAPPLRRDQQGRRTVFLCDGCSLERPVDVTFAWNMLVRDGHELPLADAIAAEKRAVEALCASMEAAE